LEITVRTQDKVKIVKLRGDVRLGEPANQLNEAFREIFDSGEARIVLDLEEVPTVDSSGIGILVRGLTGAKQRGGALKLLKPTKFVVQSLKLVALLKLFEVFEDPQQAIASFS
jgi:anti-sigma B factor antagonist